MKFINSFQSEWLKKKRSLASWLVVAGAFFTPLIILTARIKNHQILPKLHVSDDFWLRHWNQSWESMAMFLLPIGIILATGLTVQIEYKNNTWKQVNTTPQWLTTIFFAKFLVIIIMAIEVFCLFNLGLYLSAVIPAMLFSDVPFPVAPVPLATFWYLNVNFFIDCLPIVALQYLISLQFKNFLVPVGAGFALWFLSIGMLGWEYSYLLPYVHSSLKYLITSNQFGNRTILPINIELLAAVYFMVFTAASWLLYIVKKEKG